MRTELTKPFKATPSDLKFNSQNRDLLLSLKPKSYAKRRSTTKQTKSSYQKRQDTLSTN
jgi:hypothetical protein